MLETKEKATYKLNNLITPQTWDAIDTVLILADIATDERPNQTWLHDTKAKPVKAIANHLFKHHNIKLKADTKAAIGEVIASRHLKASEFEYDIVDTIDWKAGDFGDTNSCYWGDNSRDRRAIDDSDNGFAFRVHKPVKARAWAFEYAQGIVLINGYGMQTKELASLFSTIHNLQMDKVRISAPIYVNGDAGYYLHAHDTDRLEIAYLDHLDVEAMYQCDFCSAGIDEDEMFTPAEGYDSILCEDCYLEHFFYCGHSEHDAHRDDLAHVSAHYERHHDPICEDCAADHDELCQCEKCDIWHEIDDVQTVDGDEVYCDHCIAHMDAHPCYDCGALLTASNFDPVIIDNDEELWVCENCEQDLSPANNLVVCRAEHCTSLAVSGELCGYHARNLHTDNFLALGEYDANTIGSNLASDSTTASSE
jgi:hypothetical protein